VEHFYCESHKVSTPITQNFGCRVCIQIGHSKPDCKVVDLDTLNNPTQYHNILEQRIQEEPITNNNDNNNTNKENAENIKLGLKYILDEEIGEDDAGSDGRNRSI
jgi:hypothetical protein